jgi:acyl-CoA hydrolase
VHEGNTSTTYSVEVFNEKVDQRSIFSTRVTFVSVDDEGKKRRIRGGA